MITKYDAVGIHTGDVNAAAGKLLAQDILTFLGVYNISHDIPQYVRCPHIALVVYTEPHVEPLLSKLCIRRGRGCHYGIII